MNSYIHNYNENLHFLKHVSSSDSDDFRNWEIVIMHYCIIPLIDGFFSQKGLLIDSHLTRNSELRSDPKLKEIWIKYEFLYSMSKFFRYSMRGKLYDDQLENSYDKCVQNFNEIRNYINSI